MQVSGTCTVSVWLQERAHLMIQAAGLLAGEEAAVKSRLRNLLGEHLAEANEWQTSACCAEREIVFCLLPHRAGGGILLKYHIG